MKSCGNRVLIDLVLANKSFGFSGIPQDARLLFAGLNISGQLQVEGLLWSNHFNWSKKPLNTLMEQAAYLSGHINSPIKSFSLIEHILAGIIDRSVANYYRRQVLQRKAGYKVYPLVPEIDKDVIWRNYFASTVDKKEKRRLTNAVYHMTSLGLMRVDDGARRKLPYVKLNTKGFDFILFQDSRAIKVSPGTQKLIRYHDGLPVFASDTISSEGFVRSHIRSVKACSLDSVYVCNSTSSLDDLGKINERAAERACVIPYFLPKMERIDVSEQVLRQICETRISGSTARSGSEEEIIRKWFGSKDSSGKVPQYIMSLATIEPRKNYIGLINSWLKLRYESGEDIKLMIVGSPGWRYEPILSAMKPFVSSGDLMHLEKVAQIELPYLYSSAACFVFPSFGEGFGMPPSEAMQCGCPVAMSDIPAHRYSAGDAALFFDPYDLDDMVDKLKMLVFADDESMLLNELINAGYKNAERYSVATVLPKWEELFDRLSTK